MHAAAKSAQLCSAPDVALFPAVFNDLRLVLLQDALELAERFPEHPLYAQLLARADFSEILKRYKLNKANHVSGRRLAPLKCLYLLLCSVDVLSQ